jgi:transposase-like protein
VQFAGLGQTDTAAPEPLNLEICRRTRVVGIYPRSEACMRPIGMLLLEKHEDWLTDHKAYLSFDDLQDEDRPNKAMRLAESQ